MTTSSHVIFYQVKDNASKVARILETAQSHFEKGEPILFIVDDEKSQTFIDELLWKAPPESFLPHVATDEPTTEKIAITKVKKNLNNARVIFNLSATPCLIGGFRLIYELEDGAKKNIATLKFDAYKSDGFIIEAR